MSFHFQPQADSSDEDAVDISAWGMDASTQPKKNSPQPSSTLRQVDRVVAFTDPVSQHSENAKDADDTDSSPEALQKNTGIMSTSPAQRSISAKTERQTRVAFTPINSSVPQVTSDGPSDDEEQFTVEGDAAPSESEQSQELNGLRQSRLVPLVPVVDLSQIDYQDCTGGGDIVRKIIGKARGRTTGKYEVEFEDFSIELLSRSQIIALKNGKSAFQQFEQYSHSKSSEPQVQMRRRAVRRNVHRSGFVNTADAVSGDENSSEDETREPSYDDNNFVDTKEIDDIEDDDEEDETQDLKGTLRRTRNRKSSRAAPIGSGLRNAHPSRNRLQELEGFDSESNSDDLLQSDLFSRTQKRKPAGDGRKAHPEKRQKLGERQSGRTTRHRGGMQEVDVDDIYRSGSDSASRAPLKPKATSTKEVFKVLPRNDEFRMRHIQDCEVCGQGGSVFPLTHCQGCVLSYHKGCLGFRGTREHLATKVGPDDFVLQCRRCIAVPKKKEATAPDHGVCQDCNQHGNSCRPFRSRKTTAQEMREREENDGEDPVYDVQPSRINQADNVLFRCLGCWRAFHFEHLPSRSDIIDIDPNADAEQRFREYSRDWNCKECLNAPGKVSGIIAWKPIDEDNYDPGVDYEQIQESDKAYLVKWEGMSYFRSTWMPGAWVWGTTTHMMRKAFAKRENSRHPKMRTEDAIPEDYLRADIVLDIKYTSIVDIRTQEVDKARIREIDKALIKYKGLGYEDTVWEAPPSPDDGDRWTDFVLAYNDWVLGRYVRQPRGALKNRIEKARKEDFTKFEKQAQPDNLEGGQLMKYQIEGLNWLYYKWFTNSNAILADEMGLGKTIQIIGFIAALVQDHSCYPFLIVVPNSTCPNWRREIKRWAPSLRVVAFYGSKESRDLAYKYELFPEGSKDLRCHVVVTSYDAAADESSRKFFRSVPWQGLVVDEGQRLKNDRNLLYSALTALKVPFKILLTGTPLQNNARELFNLLQFIDDSFDASSLEAEYEDLDHAKIEALHELIRPFFLRRTKAQVLTFLPPMAQIIVPVSMTLLQKKVYRSILAKNPDLMKAIFSNEGSLKASEKGSLSNILMQLRKCLCHPFVYSKGIEERNVSISASHQNLVEASSKLKLLELLLPKLKERGHRVLIFSQFLDMLDMVEDFLEGLQIRYQRLDGTINALQKQKRIDAFNEPGSPLTAFLLSTRAGGVGINLATADTVIILDPDFNPHQDIQALSRAHRIGQNKKVLCFQIVTRASAEERIMQVGRKKLALDHVLIQEMDADDAEQNDLVSILRHGASSVFEDSGDQDIVYDAASVERLIDRSHMENTQAGVDKSAEAQFSFARVWANDSAALEDAEQAFNAEELAPDPGVWANILKERERAAAEEAAALAESFGRGRRARMNVDYAGDQVPEGVEGMNLTAIKPHKIKNGDESDTDFQAYASGRLQAFLVSQQHVVLTGTDHEDDAQEGEDGSDVDPNEVTSFVSKENAKHVAAFKKNGKTSPKRNVIPKTTLQNPKSTPKKTSGGKPKMILKKSLPQKPKVASKISPKRKKSAKTTSGSGGLSEGVLRILQRVEAANGSIDQLPTSPSSTKTSLYPILTSRLKKFNTTSTNVHGTIDIGDESDLVDSIYSTPLASFPASPLTPKMIPLPGAIQAPKSTEFSIDEADNNIIRIEEIPASGGPADTSQAAN